MAQGQGYADGTNYQYPNGQFDGRLHYLKNADNGLNIENHKDFANNQIVLQGLKDMYEEQGAGIASNTMTFFKI